MCFSLLNETVLRLREISGEDTFYKQILNLRMSLGINYVNTRKLIDFWMMNKNINGNIVWWIFGFIY